MPRPAKPLINPDTLLILSFVYRQHFADRDHITAYCTRRPVPPAKIGFGTEAIKKALRGLVEHQYLTGSKYVVKRRNAARPGGSDKLIYLLGKKGFKVLGKRPTLRHQRRIASFAPFPSRLVHEMMIPNIHTWLLMGEKAGHFTVKEVYGKDRNGGILEKYTDKYGVEHTVYINPDRALILSRGAARFPIFLECETGMMGVEHTLDHIEKYGWAWKHRLFAEKYGITDFAVVFVTKTGANMASRLEIAKRVHWMSKRVLFISEDTIDFEHPEKLMEPIFARPAGDFVGVVPTYVRSASLEAPGVSAGSVF